MLCAARRCLGNDKTIGWKNIKNGLLLDRMEGRFDLLITADRNIYSQQNLPVRHFSILVLPSNRRKIVLALGEQIAALVGQIRVGQYVVFDLSGDATIQPLVREND